MFVATGTPTAQTITNNGFFPSINSDELVKTQKLDGAISAERIVFALTLAMSDCNQSLVGWQLLQQAAGYTQLDDVPSTQINAISRLVTLYKQAVFSTAKAHLIEQYRDYDTTASGNKKAEDVGSNIDVYRRDAQWALSDMQGKSRSVVELI